MPPKRILNVDLSYLPKCTEFFHRFQKNKNALSSIKSRLLGDKFCCQRRRCCYTIFSFGIENECYMS